MEATPPGPRGEPLVGSARRYARDPFRFLEALEAAYSDLARFDLGPLDTYCVMAPDAIEQVLVTDAESYRKPDFGAGPVGDLLGEGLLMSDGETWRRQRDLAAPAFSPGRLTGLTDRIAPHAERGLADWAAGDVVDVESAMTRTTLHVICDLMLGVDLPDRRVRAIQRHLEPLGEQFAPDPVRFALPPWLPLPGDAEFDRALSALERILDDVVARRRRTLAEQDDDPTDFLALLLEAKDRGEQTDAQLRDELMTMLLAGHDTTALVLTYTLFLLSQHPEAEARVHAEVDSVVGDDTPGIDHVRQFDYVERVLQEAMRLYPPVYTMFRSPTRPVDLAGYRVPPDATVMLPQWALHRSERYWDAPAAFDPDRWLPERAADRPQFAYFPFGGGPRHCIGKHLAMLEAKVILATVARDYRLSYEGETPLALFPSLTVHPRDGMPMRVEAR
ncbi:cytochrome P450 [Halobacteriales archaeon Cl-PHB]